MDFLTPSFKLPELKGIVRKTFALGVQVLSSSPFDEIFGVINKYELYANNHVILKTTKCEFSIDLRLLGRPNYNF